MSQYSPYQYSSFNLDYNTLSHYHKSNYHIITNRYKLLNQSSASAHPGNVNLVHVLPLPPTKTALSLIGMIGIISLVSITSIWVTIRGGLVTRYRTKKIKFLDFLCSSHCSSIFFRIFSLIPNNASIQEVV